MNLVPIPLPSWARAPHVEVEPAFGRTEHARIEAQRDALLKALDEAVTNWVATHARAEGFPSRDRLSGAYYVSDEHYWVNDEPWFEKAGRSREVRFAIFVRCLEKTTATNRVDCDYLGLELQFSWDAEAGKFAWEGIDSSSI